MFFLYLCAGLQNVNHFLSDGVIGNTSDFGSEESRFEPWSDNNRRKSWQICQDFFILTGASKFYSSDPGKIEKEHQAGGFPKIIKSP